MAVLLFALLLIVCVTFSKNEDKKSHYHVSACPPWEKNEISKGRVVRVGMRRIRHAGCDYCKFQ